MPEPTSNPRYTSPNQMSSTADRTSSSPNRRSSTADRTSSSPNRRRSMAEPTSNPKRYTSTGQEVDELTEREREMHQQSSTANPKSNKEGVLGLCESCYKDVINDSGGVHPAFQYAEREPDYCSVSKSEKQCSEKGEENIDGAEASDESGNFSDINDEEVDSYIQNEEEKKYKKIIWEEMNREYLEEQAAKEAAVKAATEALNANKSNCPEYARKLVEASKAAVTKSRKVDELTEREREMHQQSSTANPKSNKEGVLGLCESCYKDVINDSGGVHPAFQYAEREPDYCSVSKSEKQCSEKGEENIDGAEASDESGNFSDINDEEVDSYIQNEEEKKYKKIIWEEMNREYLEEQAAKEAAVKAATEALNANKSNCPEYARKLVEASKAAVTKSRKVDELTEREREMHQQSSTANPKSNKEGVLGLCESCYKDVINDSGGVHPAFQYAEREPDYCSVSKSEKQCSEKGEENIDGAEASDESDNFSDINDEEVDSYIQNEEEKKYKKIIWEEMNREYLEEQAAKEAAVKAATEALNANKSNCPEYARKLVEASKAAVTKSRKVDELTEREREMHQQSSTANPKSNKEGVLGLCESCYKDVINDSGGVHPAFQYAEREPDYCSVSKSEKQCSEKGEENIDGAEASDESGNFSDINDEEVDSYIQNEEEKKYKKIIWEEMNREYLEEQAAKEAAVKAATEALNANKSNCPEYARKLVEASKAAVTKSRKVDELTEREREMHQQSSTANPKSNKEGVLGLCESCYKDVINDSGGVHPAFQYAEREPDYCSVSKSEKQCSEKGEENIDGAEASDESGNFSDINDEEVDSYIQNEEEKKYKKIIWEEMNREYLEEQAAKEAAVKAATEALNANKSNCPEYARKLVEASKAAVTKSRKVDELTEREREMHQQSSTANPKSNKEGVLGLCESCYKDVINDSGGVHPAFQYAEREPDYCSVSKSEKQCSEKGEENIDGAEASDESGNFSDINDEEVDSYIQNEEEKKYKKIIWEEMNREYLEEQAAKEAAVKAATEALNANKSNCPEYARKLVEASKAAVTKSRKVDELTEREREMHQQSSTANPKSNKEGVLGLCESCYKDVINDSGGVHPAFQYAEREPDYCSVSKSEKQCSEKGEENIDGAEASDESGNFSDINDEEVDSYIQNEEEKKYKKIIWEEMNREYLEEQAAKEAAVKAATEALNANKSNCPEYARKLVEASKAAVTKSRKVDELTEREREMHQQSSTANPKSNKEGVLGLCESCYKDVINDSGGVHPAFQYAEREPDYCSVSKSEKQCSEKGEENIDGAEASDESGNFSDINDEEVDSYIQNEEEKKYKKIIWEEMNREYLEEQAAKEAAVKAATEALNANKSNCPEYARKLVEASKAAVTKSRKVDELTEREREMHQQSSTANPKSNKEGVLGLCESCYKDVINDSGGVHPAFQYAEREPDYCSVSKSEKQCSEKGEENIDGAEASDESGNFSDINDEEVDSYIQNEEEKKYKKIIWEEMNREYLEEQAAKEAAVKAATEALNANKSNCPEYARKLVEASKAAVTKSRKVDELTEREREMHQQSSTANPKSNKEGVLGLCESCYKDVINDSGGVHPAFQYAEREPDYCSVSKSEKQCSEKGEENIDGAEASDESGNFSDINDEEVDSYIQNEEEKKYKKIIWEEMNREYLEEQAAKEAAVKAATEALNANKSNCPEYARKLVEASKAAVTKSRKVDELTEREREMHQQSSTANPKSNKEGVLGLCESCYKDVINDSGGVHPAFQYAEREPDYCSVSKSEKQCSEKGEENIDGAEASDESGNFSDINDEEVDSYIQNEEEKKYKKIIWEEMNREYLEEQAAKEAAVKAATEALNANKSNCPEYARKLVEASKAAVTKSREENGEVGSLNHDEQLSGISLLPEELLHEIFVRVAPEKKTCLLVCRSWRSLIRRQQKTLRITESKEPLPSLKKRGFESLSSLTIDHCLAIGGDGTNLLTDEDLVRLADEFPELESLELLGCDDVTAEGLVSFVKRCPKLRFLHVQTCPHFDDEALITVVKSCTALEHLRVAFCEVTSAGMDELGKLTVVSFIGCPLSLALRSFPFL